ncbi:MFS transporter [Salipiger sp.]|uniref:MFS transporter n=1 Tax=Salipiger sp. TaxID=2078585 RepID=UPI003A97B71E
MSDAVAGDVPRSLRRNGDYLRFLACRGCLVTAFQMLSVAVGWDVYARTGDPMDLALIGLFMFLPILCFSIPAGVAADRVDRRRIIGTFMLLHFLSISAIGCWFAFGGAAVWPVFLLLLVSGSAHAFVHPALHSTLPKLVDRAVFSNAVAGASSITKIAQLVGPALGGVLIAVGGQVVYLVAAACFLVAAVAGLTIRTDLRIEAPEPFSLGLFLGGFVHIWQTPTVFAAISIDLIAVLFGGVMGILPVYAVDILHVGPEALGLMRGAPAVGAFSVGALLAWFRFPWHVGRAFFVSLGVFGIAIVLFGLSRHYLLSLGALYLYGAADMVSVYVRQTLIQLDTPDALRGRVSAVNSVTVNASNQMGDFRAGSMAAMFGAPVAVAVGGAVTLGATLIWYRKFPALRGLARF